MRRLPMRKIRDVLRLHAAGRSARQIGPSLGVGRSSVAEYLRRAEVAGVSWPLPEGLDEAALERRLFPPPPPSKGRQIPEPDWAAVHRELKRPGVTLALLWDEYRGGHPDGYGYSAFCEHYRRWAGRLSPVMRQRHAAGERMFVDYSGTRMAVIDPATGTPRPAEIFIACSGPRTRPMPRRPGARRCPTGSAPILAPSPPSGRRRRWSCPTISSPA